jgi:hypothetical protein
MSAVSNQREIWTQMRDEELVQAEQRAEAGLNCLATASGLDYVLDYVATGEREGYKATLAKALRLQSEVVTLLNSLSSDDDGVER